MHPRPFAQDARLGARHHSENQPNHHMTELHAAGGRRALASDCEWHLEPFGSKLLRVRRAHREIHLTTENIQILGGKLYTMLNNTTSNEQSASNSPRKGQNKQR